MDKYVREFKTLKPEDHVNSIEDCTLDSRFKFISTAGHGYLVVPRDSMYHFEASKRAVYGYNGALAAYLEEDCEAPEFLTWVIEREARMPAIAVQ